jgi:hypothetical protein
MRADNYLETTISKRLNNINATLSEDELQIIKKLDRKFLYYLELKDTQSLIKITCELLDCKTTIYSKYFTNPESICDTLKYTTIVELRECFYY